MIFEHSFFEDEIRCDYLIPSMVKRTWAAQIQILADLDEACRKSGISFFAEWGSLLGTVRHGGFIPWDDDLDICMKRKDYEYFISNPEKILPDNYSIVNYRTSREFKQFLSRIVSSDHYRFDPEYMRKYSGLPFALGLDIFPLDFLTDDEEYEKERERRVRLVYDVVNEIAFFDTPLSKLSGSIKAIEKEFGIRINAKDDVLTRLRDLLIQLFSEVDEKDAAFITMYPLWMDDHSYRFPKEYYEHSIRMRFENTLIPVPVCYEDILKRKYGASFMTPVRSGGAHEYPYYEDHVNVLKEHFGFEWPSYKFNKNDLCTGDPDKHDPVKNEKCLFITYGLPEFENMRSLVRKYIDSGCDVTIFPATKFDIAPDMSGITSDPVSYPDDMYLYGLDGARISHDQSVADTHFDTIVTNCQYDEYNLITTVDRNFYSGALREKCDRLIYVPAHETSSIKPEDERAVKLMPLYVNTPLVARADEIVLHSDEMRDRYIECLTAFSGEEHRSVWEKKITVLKDPEENTQPKRGKKKKILFYVGIATFAQNADKAIEKLQSVFDIFDENKDRTDVVFELQDGLCDNLKEMFPSLYEKFIPYLLRVSNEVTYIEDIDAYYGEPSSLATDILNAKKPVMIMTV